MNYNDLTLKRGDQLGGWLLVKRLGAGGNAEVWLAVNADTRAAVKVLRSGPDERFARFRDEIAFLLEGDPGPGVLPLIDHSLPDSPLAPHWYAMPLARLLKKALGPAAEPAAVVTAVSEIASTLSRLAEKGVGHRDIKPANLYELDGAFLVGDFGLATYPEKDPVTRTGRRLGPIDYMAPEMRDGADEAAAGPADVYSLAKTLWVLLTGANLPLPGPHRVDDEAYSLRTYLADPYVAELDLHLEAATRHDPSARPAMAEVAKELTSWLDRASKPIASSSITEVAREIRVLTERDRRTDERIAEKMRLASASLERLKADALSIVHNERVGQITGLRTTYGAGHAFQQVSRIYESLSGAFHSAGWQSAAHSVGAHPVYLISAVGFDLARDDRIQLTAAYGLERYLPGDHERRALWLGQRVEVVGSAAERLAIDDLTREMLENLDGALQEFTAWLRERPLG